MANATFAMSLPRLDASRVRTDISPYGARVARISRFGRMALWASWDEVRDYLTPAISPRNDRVIVPVVVYHYERDSTRGHFEEPCFGEQNTAKGPDDRWIDVCSTTAYSQTTKETQMWQIPLTGVGAPSRMWTDSATANWWTGVAETGNELVGGWQTYSSFGYYGDGYTRGDSLSGYTGCQTLFRNIAAVGTLGAANRTISHDNSEVCSGSHEAGSTVAPRTGPVRPSPVGRVEMRSGPGSSPPHRSRITRQSWLRGEK